MKVIQTRVIGAHIGRFLAVIALTLASVGVGVTATPGAAQAADSCYYGAFCWYYLTNQSGTRGSMTQYTSTWIRMPSLVDDSRSSYDAQYADGCLATNNPYVYMRDTGTPYGTITKLVGSYYGHKINDFSTLDSRWNLNDNFNDIYNACRH